MITPSSRVAIINGEQEITFTQMLQRISIYAQHTPALPTSKTLILSENRAGWIYALYAIWNNHGIAVPVDAASTAHEIAYILQDCKPETVWTSVEKKPLLDEAVREAGVEVQVLLIDDYESADTTDTAVAEIKYDLQDTCLICYTSGTTGSPKGVMLSFENVMANVQAVWKDVPIFNEHRRTIILLPLHHVLPLVGSAVIPFIAGGGVAICPSLAAADIMSTLQRGRISIMIGVPRLWQMLYRGIKAKIDAKAITRALYSLCEHMQSRRLSRLVFSSVRAKMGGAITYCVSGGAALDSCTARGLKTLGLDVLEGYGMTETAPMITFTRPDDIRPGCVGKPVPAVEVKLVDGELCARGRNVMQGYYNRPEETAAIIDPEGWVHTGDLATIDEEGRVTITGRKKEIIVLSNGKNVNPTEIEDKLDHYANIIKEVAVTHKDDMLCAIVVPQEAWRTGKSLEQMQQIIKDEVLQPYNQSVAPYKKIMSLHLHLGELPRTRLEKIQRFKLQELLSTSPTEGQTSTQAALEFTPEGRILADYIGSEKHLDVHPTDHLETDLAMDSLDKVALQGFIEQTFGMKITTDEIGAMPHLAALADHVANQKTREQVENIDWQKILSTPNAKSTHLHDMPLTGRLFTRLCNGFYRLMFSPEVKGLENVPTDRPVIFAPNHQSYLDGPLVVVPLQSELLRRTYFYAKKEHIHGPLARLISRNHNIVVMDMSTLSDSIRQLADILRGGRNLVIFPEGTRTRNGEIGMFKKTFAILASELHIDIVPVRIKGAYEAWPRQQLLPRPHRVSVEYLPPITPAEGEIYEQLAERVRQAIER